MNAALAAGPAARPAARPATRFVLPDELSAPSPPEARGVPRDQVRLLVADDHGVSHARFAALGDFLDPGDLLVVNTSGTVAAAADGVRLGDGSPVVVHFSGTLDGGEKMVELRTAPDASTPVRDARPGEQVRLGEAVLTLVAPYPEDNRRLWRAEASVGLQSHLDRHGRPIRYGYVAEPWPLEAYQTVFATEPGSAEMPSAGRPFTADLVTRLTAAGIVIAPVTLHAGVSSQEAGEPPLPERFRVPAATAHLVSWTRRCGRRVIAVGTTAVRAIESAVTDGTVHPANGTTELVIGPERPARVVDSLITGLHAPDASHLLMLEAIAGPGTVQRAYDAALRARYLWHEFGDLSLLRSHRAGG